MIDDALSQGVARKKILTRFSGCRDNRLRIPMPRMSVIQSGHEIYPRMQLEDESAYIS